MSAGSREATDAETAEFAENAESAEIAESAEKVGVPTSEWHADSIQNSNLSSGRGC